MSNRELAVSWRQGRKDPDKEGTESPGEWARTPGTGWTQDLWRPPAFRGRQRNRLNAGGKKLATVTGAF